MVLLRVVGCPYVGFAADFNSYICKPEKKDWSLDFFRDNPGNDCNKGTNAHPILAGEILREFGLG